MRRVLLAPLVLAMSGCATTYQEPVLSADHPASPEAQASLLSPRLSTLTVRDTVAAPATGTEHEDHGATGHVNSAAEDGGSKHESPSHPALYACPMHPEVTSDKPDQRCPKCNMKLKEVDGGKQP